MEFLKKNYEKIVLGVVLLGLTGAVGLLPVIIGDKRQKLEKMSNELLQPRITQLPALDTSFLDTAMREVQTPMTLDFTRDHNTFNPVLWTKGTDNRPLKSTAGPTLGPAALEITEIKPLYLWLTYHSASGSGYLVGYTNQAAQPPKRRTGETLASHTSPKNDYFTLVDVHGPEDKPTEIILSLNENGQQVALGPEKPYRRVEGYAADLKYLGSKVWKDQQVGKLLIFPEGQGQYNIVAITETNVIIKSTQNDKKTTINFKAPTEPR
jgi:hypothetical protein